MSSPYSGATAFDTATCTAAWIEYPFANFGDSSTKVYRHTMQVARDKYSPLSFNTTMGLTNKPSRSPFSDDSNAYWVGDSTPTNINGELVEFERTFAHIPTSRVDPYGLYPMQVAGRAATSGVDVTSTGNESVTLNAALDYAEFVFNVSSGDVSYFSVGQKLWIKNDVRSDDKFQIAPTAWTNVYAQDAYVTSISGNTITAQESVDAGVTHYVSTTPITTFTIPITTSSAVSPYVKNSPARMELTYQKIDDPSDLVLSDKFHILNSSGELTDTVTSSTTPTLTEYNTFVSDGIFKAAEAQTFSRWMGNIYEKRRIVAQLY